MQLPTYRNFTSYDIDLDQLTEALSHHGNWITLEESSSPPSQLLLEISSDIEARKKSSKSSILTPEDGLLFEKHFATRLAVNGIGNIISFLDYQAQSTFAGNIDQLNRTITKVIKNNRRWFPKGGEFEADINDYLSEKLKIVVDEPENISIKGLTIAQSVLALMIINRENRISFSQDRKPFQEFIAALTGKDFRKIGNRMAKFCHEDSFLLQETAEMNLTDYKEIKNLFENLENKKALEFIDNQILAIKKMLPK